MPGEEPQSNVSEAVKEVKHLRMRGKDYLYCKMYLMAKGFTEGASNNIWYVAEKTQSSSEAATKIAMQGPYFGIIFFGGFLSVFAFLTVVKYLGPIIAVVFSLVFMRYSSFWVKRTPLGFALSVKSDLYAESEPPEARWFNYGVIAGVMFFFVGVSLFPSFLGWTWESLLSSLFSVTDPATYFPKA